MVTHNMQQAVRVSDKTVFFLLGEVIESGETEKSCFPYRRISGQRIILPDALDDEGGVA